jgi:hypothetical protein
MAAQRGNKYAAKERRGRSALDRFRALSRFEPETGCVLWIGGTTMGRGHHIPYPAFWFEGKRWFGHRWSAKHIHGLDIEGFHVDHCCPNISKPNTLCVEHVQAITPRLNRQLQETRKTFIHLQVGLLRYEEVYGPDPDAEEFMRIPFYSPPAWLGSTGGLPDVDCPF